MFLRITIIFLTICFSSLYSEDSGFSAGAGIGLNMGIYSANFIEFEGIESCGLYESGNSSGLSPYINFDYKLSSDFYLSNMLNISFVSGKLAKEDTAFVYNPNLDSRVNVETNNELTLNYSGLQFSPQINYIISEDFINGPFRVYVGPRVSFNLSSTFTQRERILNPNGSYFDVGGQLRLERISAEGNITTFNQILTSGVIGLNKKLDIGNDLDINLRAEYERGFTSILSDADLNFSAFNLWVGINYNFQKTEIIKEIIPPKLPPLPTPLMVEEPISITLNSSIDYTNSSIIYNTKPINYVPLINSVFFEVNSDKIPNQYLTENNSNNSIQNHYNVLNNALTILKNNSESTINLTPSISKSEADFLKTERAKKVEKFFLKNGINTDRIIITENYVVKTSEKTENGEVENQRVEIEFNNYFESIALDTLSKSVKSKIDYELESDKKIDKYSPFTIRSEFHNDININDLDASTTIQKTFQPEKESLNIYSEVSNNFNGDNRLTLFDDANSSLEFDKISNKSSKIESYNFSAVLVFDFVSDVLSDKNKNLIREIISIAPENATIEVIGNTDKIGTEIFNTRLAEERASKTTKYINDNNSKNLNIISTTNKNKYPEDTPQGRFLNRSVRVVVRGN